MARVCSIVDRLDELFNARDWDGYGELLDEHLELVMSGVAIRGRAAVIDFFKAATSTRPALRVGSRQLIAETEDTLVTEVRMIEEVAELEYSAGVVHRVASGRIVEWLVYVDRTAEASASAAFMAMAAEQSALRRVAELVARQPLPEQVFALVTQELSRLLEVDMVRTVRFEPDGTATVVAALGMAEDPIPPGTNAVIPSGSVIDKVSRTSRPARVDDYAQVGGPIGARLSEEGAGSAAGGPIVVDGRLWGAMVACKTGGATLPPGTEGRVAQFAELMSTAISNIESRAKVERLAAEQSALRRVAEQVARLESPEQLFSRVTNELSRLLDVTLVWTVRFQPDGSATVLAASASNRLPPGTNVALLPGGVLDQVLRTGRPARVDDPAHLRDPSDAEAFDRFHDDRVRCAAGGPIVVDGQVWGAMLAASAETLAPGIEDQIAQFAELVSTAISNIESRAKVAGLVAEQSALRRVAELVARQAPSEEVFDLVTEELSRLLGVDLVWTARFEPDGSVTRLAACGEASDLTPPDTNAAIPSGSVVEKVSRTGRPARVDDYATVAGPDGALLRKHGLRCGAGGPIVVDGRIWGAMLVASKSALPPGSEDRVTQFAELVSTAISNLESRAKVEQLAAEQAALRRVATLVAREPASEQLLSAVAREVASVLNVPGVIVTRDEADGSVVTLGAAFDSELADGDRYYGVGTRTPRDPGSLAAQVFETLRPARIDDFSALPGTIGERARAAGFGSGCAGPIVVNGVLWGKMCVFSPVGTVLPLGTENRLNEFIELIATAIANYEAHADLAASEARARELAHEQAALRRVATLVAEGAAPNRVFDAVRHEVEQMFGIPNTILMRFDPDGIGTLLATPGDYLGPAGKQWPLEGDDSAVARVHRTGRAARADYTAGAVGPLAQAAQRGGTLFPVAVPVVVDAALWGAMSVGSPGPQQPPPDLEGRLAKFTDLLATAVANAESRADLAASEARARELASEQSSLRRVATLVAHEHSAEDLFATLAEEVGVLLGVDASSILRYEADASVTVVAGWTDGTFNLPIGERVPLEGENLSGEILRTGKPRRKEGYRAAPGAIGALARELGIRSAVASPIAVDGKTWGMISVLCRQPEPLPPDTEARLAEFSRVAGLAVANAKSRADLAASEARARELAEEQAALRRVATAVAQGAAPGELFSLVAREAIRVLDIPRVAIDRYEADGTVTILGIAGETSLWIGTRWPVRGVAEMTLASGQPSRQDDEEGLPAQSGDPMREALAEPWREAHSAVGVPIVVEGSLWGLMYAAANPGTPLPTGTEERLARFTELVATAVSNATTRTELLASRARVVTAADETRRRFERDLHDGAQQRLVSLGLALRSAETTVPAELGDLASRLSRLGTGLSDVLDDLRELSRGLHPAVLSEDGLSPALQSLALRSGVPVDLRVDLDPERLAAPVEVAAYYVASEALTNVAKHAHASRAQVRASRRDGWLDLVISDDGRGGADASSGSGLTGLIDRVEAIGGTIQIESPPEAGTSIHVRLPYESRTDEERSRQVPRPVHRSRRDGLTQRHVHARKPET